MAKDELRPCLDYVLKTIRDGLSERLAPEFVKAQKKLEKKLNLHDTVSQIKKKEAKIKQLQDEVKVLKEEKDNKDGRVWSGNDFKGEDEARSLWYFLRFGDLTKTKEQAVIQIKNCPAAKNALAFLELERDVNRTYRLAATKKEKRAIIIQLQARDWASLGIDLPNFTHFSDFDIKDGVINLSANRALSKPVEKV